MTTGVAISATPVVTELWRPAAGRGPERPRSGGETLVRQHQLSLDVAPAWADHAFFRQPDNWPHSDDRFPLVPMTGIVEMLMQTASDLHPELVPVAVEEVGAFRWLAVDPPVEVTIRATTLNRPRPRGDTNTYVKVAIDGHARATVVMASAYPSAPRTPVPQLVNGRPSHIDASRFYTDRHMFHGPAYQGIHEFLTVADNGSRALLRSLPAPGALLDNAGQLMGHWLSAQDTSDRLVLPTSIERLEFFGPQPPMIGASRPTRWCSRPCSGPSAAGCQSTTATTRSSRSAGPTLPPATW